MLSRNRFSSSETDLSGRIGFHVERSQCRRLKSTAIHENAAYIRDSRRALPGKPYRILTGGPSLIRPCEVRRHPQRLMKKVRRKTCLAKEKSNAIFRHEMSLLNGQFFIQIFVKLFCCGIASDTSAAETDATPAGVGTGRGRRMLRVCRCFRLCF